MLLKRRNNHQKALWQALYPRCVLAAGHLHGQETGHVEALPRSNACMLAVMQRTWTASGFHAETYQSWCCSRQGEPQ